MDLAAVYLERFKTREGIARSVAVRLAEIETHQDNSQFLVHGRYPIADTRMGNDALRPNVFAAGASTRTRHHVPVLESIRIWRERRLNGFKRTADLEPGRIKFCDSNQVATRHLL